MYGVRGGGLVSAVAWAAQRHVEACSGVEREHRTACAWRGQWALGRRIFNVSTPKRVSSRAVSASSVCTQGAVHFTRLCEEGVGVGGVRSGRARRQGGKLPGGKRP